MKKTVRKWKMGVLLLFGSFLLYVFASASIIGPIVHHIRELYLNGAKELTEEENRDLIEKTLFRERMEDRNSKQNKQMVANRIR